MEIDRTISRTISRTRDREVRVRFLYFTFLVFTIIQRE